MASGTDSPFIPFILGLTAAVRLQDPTNPPQETRDPPTARASSDRIIIINPSTQTMAVFETNSVSSALGLGSLFQDLLSRKGGQRPASRASIDSLPRVQIARGVADDDGQCVVCLEEWGDGETAKEMPCKHRFHGGCIEKWLKINRCCPVCRYEMPVDDEDDDSENKSGGESDGDGMRRDIWMSLSVVGGMRNSENGVPPSDHEESEG
ncbi:hypothetical protein OROHE_022988 [Orobanche hederae]